MPDKKKPISKHDKYLHRSHVWAGVSLLIALVGFACTFFAYSLDSTSLAWLLVLGVFALLSFVAFAVSSVCEDVVLKEEAKHPWTEDEWENVAGCL